MCASAIVKVAPSTLVYGSPRGIWTRISGWPRSSPERAGRRVSVPASSPAELRRRSRRFERRPGQSTRGPATRSGRPALGRDGRPDAWGRTALGPADGGRYGCWGRPIHRPAWRIPRRHLPSPFRRSRPSRRFRTSATSAVIAPRTAASFGAASCIARRTCATPTTTCGRRSRRPAFGPSSTCGRWTSARSGRRRPGSHGPSRT